MVKDSTNFSQTFYGNLFGYGGGYGVRCVVFMRELNVQEVFFSAGRMWQPACGSRLGVRLSGKAGKCIFFRLLQ